MSKWDEGQQRNEASARFRDQSSDLGTRFVTGYLIRDTSGYGNLRRISNNTKHKAVMQNWIINKCIIMFIPYGTWIVEQRGCDYFSFIITDWSLDNTSPFIFVSFVHLLHIYILCTYTKVCFGWGRKFCKKMQCVISARKLNLSRQAIFISQLSWRLFANGVIFL